MSGSQYPMKRRYLKLPVQPMTQGDIHVGPVGMLQFHLMCSYVRGIWQGSGVTSGCSKYCTSCRVLDRSVTPCRWMIDRSKQSLIWLIVRLRSDTGLCLGMREVEMHRWCIIGRECIVHTSYICMFLYMESRVQCRPILPSISGDTEILF